MNNLRLLVATALLLSLAACSSGTATPSGGSTSSAAANIYAINVAGSSNGLIGQILTFPATATVTANPTSTFSAALNITFGYLTSDSSGNIYAISSAPYSSANTSVAVYTHTAGGALSLSRTITSTAMSGQGPIAVDKSGNLYVSQYNKVLVFSPTASGASTPTATISGYGGNMAADANGNMYVQSGSSVAEFNASSITSGLPSRTITNAAFNGPVSSVSSIAGIATDASGNLYVLADLPTVPSFVPQILVFSSTATGSATAARTITGSATKMYQPAGLAVDGAGTIYVSDYTSSAPLEGLFLEFSSTATGNVAPSSSFVSPAMTYGPSSIAVF